MRKDCPPPESKAQAAQREAYARARCVGASGVGAYRKSLEVFHSYKIRDEDLVAYDARDDIRLQVQAQITEKLVQGIPVVLKMGGRAIQTYYPDGRVEHHQWDLGR